MTFRPDLKEAIAQDIIDFIIDRTQSGKDVEGRSFKGYSKEYAESLEFQAFGKSKSEVNLTLSGQMLGTMDLIDTSGDSIIIGWTDAEESAKAFNHQTGDTVPARPFFGISERDLENEILPKYRSELEKSETEIISERARELLVNIGQVTVTERQLGGFFFGDEEEGF